MDVFSLSMKNGIFSSNQHTKGQNLFGPGYEEAASPEDMPGKHAYDSVWDMIGPGLYGVNGGLQVQ